MSVSDPLIKDIKGYIIKFLEDIKEFNCISDANPNLIVFCENIEKIFNYGILSSHNTFGFTKPNDPWTWLEKISNLKDDIITFGYINSVEYVKRYQSILTNVGKLRLLIRNCLNRKSLHVPVEYLVKHNKFNAFYKENAILGDEILSEIFLSLLLQCSTLTFKLDLTNISFLNKAWILPKMLKLELVPCKNLGMSVSFADDQAVIMDIKSNSVISDNGKIEVGDILDNLNGVHICGVTKGKLNSILKSNKGQPVTVTIIKAKYDNTNQLYQPIISLLKQVRLDPVELKTTRGVKESEQVKKKSNSAGFKATYLGGVNVGKTGDVRQIDKAVRIILSPYRNNMQCPNSKHKVSKKSIYLEVGEIGVKIVDSQTSEVILKHSYMEISSCGSVSNMPHYFAYISGNEYCNQATEFTCHVFHIKNSDLACIILQSIGQGFQRTHFAV